MKGGIGAKMHLVKLTQKQKNQKMKMKEEKTYTLTDAFGKPYTILPKYSKHGKKKLQFQKITVSR